LRGLPGFLLKDTPHFIAALLFHKACYDPRNIRLSIRRSCEFASQYYPGEKTVALFSLIKATRFGALISHRYHDDRAYIADISIYMYGLPWEDFRRIWAQTLKEFEASDYKPVRFKKLTIKQLRKMLFCAESFGLYQTRYFRDKFEIQAITNIKQLLEEISA
jgi:predicted metal-dependent HD superfamily phosphohydrolase